MSKVNWRIFDELDEKSFVTTFHSIYSNIRTGVFHPDFMFNFMLWLLSISELEILKL